MSLAGCAAGAAASVEPSSTAPAEPAGPPRPSASPGFASRGPAKVIHSIDTKEPVVFLTIDDGLDAEPEVMQYLNDNDIPATVFLTTGTVSDWQYWRDFGEVGSLQNHTVVHPELPTLGQAGAAKEICDANDVIAQEAGQSPWMLRPPYGAYDSSTLAAAGQCGLDWAVHWTVSLPGDELEYQSVGGSLKPGDIILTHFRKGLAQTLPKVVKDIRAQGFQIARLEDYLPPRDWSGTAAGQQTESRMQTATESRAYPVQ